MPHNKKTRSQEGARPRADHQKEAPTPGGGLARRGSATHVEALNRQLPRQQQRQLVSCSAPPSMPTDKSFGYLGKGGDGSLGNKAAGPAIGPGLPPPARGRSTAPRGARMAAQQPGSSRSHRPRAAAGFSRQAGPQWAWAAVGNGRGGLLEGRPPNVRGGAACCQPWRFSSLETARLTLPRPTNSSPPPAPRPTRAGAAPPTSLHGSVWLTPPHAAGSSGGESLDRARADLGLGLRAWATRALSLGAGPRPCRAAP